MIHLRPWQRVLIGVPVSIGVLAGVILVMIWSVKERPVRYDGKPMEGWLQDLNGQDATVSNLASAELSAQIIPQLTNQMFLDTQDSHLRMKLIELLNELPGVELQYEPALYRRAAAARRLGDIGPLAQLAVPALLQALTAGDSVVRSRAAESLGRIHTDAGHVVPALVNSLSDTNSEVRASAAEALSGWGKEAQPAVPRLVQLLDDRSDRDLMTAVREALKQIDPDAAAKAGVK